MRSWWAIAVQMGRLSHMALSHLLSSWGRACNQGLQARRTVLCPLSLGFFGVCVFSFLTVPGSMWNLSSPTRDLTCGPCMEVWVLTTESPGTAPSPFLSFFPFFSHLSLYLQTLVWWWWKTYLPTRERLYIFHCWWKTPVRSVSSTHLSLNFELSVSLNKNSMTKVTTEQHPSY